MSKKGAGTGGKNKQEFSQDLKVEACTFICSTGRGHGTAGKGEEIKKPRHQEVQEEKEGRLKGLLTSVSNL